MAVIRELTDGVTTISLVAIDAIHRLRGGFDGVELRQEELEERAGIGGTVVENHRLNMAIGSGDTVDDVADQLAALTTLLRKAYLNNAVGAKSWSPVWLKEQAEGEAGPRYATLIRAAGLKFPDFLRDPFRALTYLQDFGLNLVREHPWRDYPPGTLPASPVTLDDADGPANPTEAILANEWSAASLTHVYAYDDSPPAVVNPGFETAGGGGADIWANWNEVAGDGALADEAVLVHGGAHACKMTAGPTSNTIVQSTSIVVIPGTNYLASLWTRGDGVHQGYWGIYDATHAAWITLAGQGEAGTTYTQKTLAFTTPAGCVAILFYLICSIVNGGVCYYDDVSLNWSANLIAAHSVALFPAAPAVGDYVIFGFDNAAGLIGHHIAVPVGTIPTWTGLTLDVQYSTGPGAYTTMPTGTLQARWPTGNVNQLFGAIGWWVINVGGAISGWQAIADGPGGAVTRYWIMVKIMAIAAGVGPVLHATNSIYSPRTPYFDLPAASTVGDAPPLLLMRFTTPRGGQITPAWPNTSRILIGAKSKPDLPNFRSHINLGGYGNPGAIAISSLIADTTFVAGPHMPGGYYAHTTFATDPSEVARLRVTFTGLLPAYIGEYELYAVIYQTAGAVGDCSVRARVRISGTSDWLPQWNGELTPLSSINLPEAMDLGRLTIPLTSLEKDDVLTGVSFYLDLLAKRASGAATLEWICLILMPMDEWWTVLEDPVSSVVFGSSALRGDCALDVDAGVVRRRCVKSIIPAAGLLTPAEPWGCKSFPNRLEPGTTYRFFTLSMYYPTTFGTPPLAWAAGQQLAVKIYAHDRWHTLMASAP